MSSKTVSFKLVPLSRSVDWTAFYILFCLSIINLKTKKTTILKFQTGYPPIITLHPHTCTCTCVGIHVHVHVWVGGSEKVKTLEGTKGHVAAVKKKRMFVGPLVNKKALLYQYVLSTLIILN